MAEYNSSAFDFGMSFDFTTFGQRNTSAAPKVTEEPKAAPSPRIVKQKTRTKKSLLADEIRTAYSAAKIMIVTAALALLVGSAVYGNAYIVELEAQRQQLEAEYKEQIGENVRLVSETEKMYSADEIATFAEEKLGMIKKDDYKVYYYSVQE